MRKVNWLNVGALALIVLTLVMIAFFVVPKTDAQEGWWWISKSTKITSEPKRGQQEVGLFIDIAANRDSRDVWLIGEFTLNGKPFGEGGIVFLECESEYEPPSQDYLTEVGKNKFVGESSEWPVKVILVIDGEEYHFSLSRISE